MELKNLTITLDTSLRQALKSIDFNGHGIIFIVDSQNHLQGILSDGDIRRAMLNGNDLDRKVDEVMNKNFLALPFNTDDIVIIKHITERIKIIPLVDKENKLIDYASISKIRRIPIAAPLLSGNELAYVSDCIKTNWISSQGKYVRQFEVLFRF